MRYFARSTIVTPDIKIRVERLLPKSGEVVVRVGQEVLPTQVVARTLSETDFHILPASDMLRVSPADLAEQLEVEVGTALEEGTPLIQKRGLLNRKSLVSPVDGILYDINNGRLIFLQTSDWIELRASVQGRVVNHIGDQGVALEVTGTLIQADWGSGKEGYGILKVMANTAADLLRPDQINSEDGGHILVAGKANQVEIFPQAAENDVQGIIVGSLTVELYAAAPSFPFPVMVTDGIGDQSMAQPIFELLKQSEGQEASLFGHSPDHWGKRPEIIIPAAATVNTASPPAAKPITAGQTVRVLRPPHQGQIGEIVKLYTYAQTTPIGTKAHGAAVKLSDGHVVFVPYANLDAII